MILSIVFYAFLAYLIYQLVFRFIIPVVRTTRRVRRSFREMQERMQQQHTTPVQEHNRVHTTPKGDGEDYIEFEEIK